MSTYSSVHLAKRPDGEIVPEQTFETKTQPLPKESDLKDGEVILKTLYLGLDPAMRGWLNDTRSYVPPVQIGEVMRGMTIGVVTASKSSKFPTGTYAQGMSGWAEYAVVKEKLLEKIELPKNGVLTDALGLLGFTGLTAYFGILDVGKVKAGDFVVVSGAAGATGSVVAQIAKLKGCKVLGLAGSDEKCQWLVEDLGLDMALNYKDADFAKKFRDATKPLIDVYFDNVGGEILDLCLGRAKPHSTFVMCGGVSQYNAKTGETKGPKNYLMIVSMRIRMQGFIVMDYTKQFGEARKELTQWINEGKIKREDTIVPGGLKAAPQALLGLFKGANKGKMIVEIAPDTNKARL